jgi:hypothetical protein
MSKVTERANELYPNSKTFCGGVASIARDAYIKGCQETIDKSAKWWMEHIVGFLNAGLIGGIIDEFKKEMVQ